VNLKNDGTLVAVNPSIMIILAEELEIISNSVFKDVSIEAVRGADNSSASTSLATCSLSHLESHPKRRGGGEGSRGRKRRRTRIPPANEKANRDSGRRLTPFRGIRSWNSIGFTRLVTSPEPVSRRCEWRLFR